MFMRKPTNALLTSFAGRLRFMSSSNEGPVQQKKNPFVKEKLPDLPEIEVIPSKCLDFEAHASGKKTKFGDFEFMVCKDGYILSYIQAYQTRKKPQDAFYGIYYGHNHPLNTYGPVNGKQSLEHARVTAILRAIETFPHIDAKKLCICTDCTYAMQMMRSVHCYSENGYRSKKGDVLQYKDTVEALNNALRSRNDVQIRILYTPADVFKPMKEAKNLAVLAMEME